MLVYKFGGATTRSVRGLEQLAGIVARTFETESRRRKDAGLVIVVSAIGHTTRRLREIAEYAENGKAIEAGDTLERIIERHEQLADNAGLTPEAYANAITEFRRIAGEIAKLTEGVTITRELSPRTLDAFLAAGEQFSSQLIYGLLRTYDLPVELVDARRFVTTSGEFTNAKPNIEETTKRANAVVRPLLADGNIVLTQGFIGATVTGETTTMGTESSDLTATLTGVVLGAREVVIWKSVPGIFTADPELVPNAKPIRTLSFEEADEMGRRGMRALYQQVAAPLISTSSDAIIRVTMPDKKVLSGTSITLLHGHIRAPKPVALSIEQNIATLYVRSEDAANHKQSESFLAKGDGIPSFALRRAFYYWASDAEITICYPRNEKRPLIRALKEAGYAVQEERPHDAISLLVRTRDAQQNLAAIRERLLRALRRYPVRAVFPVESSFIILIDEDRSLEALKHLHREFFE